MLWSQHQIQSGEGALSRCNPAPIPPWQVVSVDIIFVLLLLFLLMLATYNLAGQNQKREVCEIRRVNCGFGVRAPLPPGLAMGTELISGFSFYHNRCNAELITDQFPTGLKRIGIRVRLLSSTVFGPVPALRVAGDPIRPFAVTYSTSRQPKHAYAVTY